MMTAERSAKTSPPPKTNPLKIIVPIVLLAAAGYWGFTRWSYGQSHESTDNAQVDGHIVPVVAKVGGYVLSVSAGENVHVGDNSVLVRIDEREYQVRLAQADADLAAARASSGDRGQEGQAAAMVRSASSQRDASDAQTDVAPTVGGKITAVNFDLGSYVNKGDV